ncbi:MAG: hypothetical protein AAGE88_18250 [Actinomycetota bacterium]
MSVRLPGALLERLEAHIQLRSILDDRTTRSQVIRDAVEEYLQGFDDEVETLRGLKADFKARLDN